VYGRFLTITGAIALAFFLWTTAIVALLAGLVTSIQHAPQLLVAYAASWAEDDAVITLSVVFLMLGVSTTDEVLFLYCVCCVSWL
jgi:hypothetical protein